MVELNIHRDAQEALDAIDMGLLEAAIKQSLESRHLSSLRKFSLEMCGTYVASKLYGLESALAAYGAAKAARKLAETENDACRAGDYLLSAVRQMKHRLEQEQTESQRFYVDDRIIAPYQLSEHLRVVISYRWRPTVDGEWQYGSIIFTHDVDIRPDYTKPTSKRKPSVARRNRDEQEKLLREWTHLTQLGLCAVRDFFRAGGDIASIPKAYKAKTDCYDRSLNNFSAQFWSEQS